MPVKASLIGKTIFDFKKDAIKIKREIDTGADGIVYAGHFTRGYPAAVAVKVFAPQTQPHIFTPRTLYPSLASDWEARFENEKSHLENIHHLNLQRYLSHGWLPYTSRYFADHGVTAAPDNDLRFPFIVSHLVEGQRLDRWLAEGRFKRPQLIRLLCGIANGVEYLHEASRIHADIRPENIIVEERTDLPVLLDFGLAKRFTKGARGPTPLMIDRNPLPTKVHDLLAKLERDSKWQRADLERVIFPWADLYFYGLLLATVLKSPRGQSVENPDREYLQLLAGELSKWVVSGTPEAPAATLIGVVRSASDINERLSRLSMGENYYEHQAALSEDNPPRIVVRARGTLTVRDSVAPLIDTAGLRRLHNLNQLSLVRYIFPSAGQSRFDHLLSTLSVVQRMGRALARCPSFLFHMSAGDMKRLELMALLHDINHFPFLHYFQEAGIQEVHEADVIDTLIGLDTELTVQFKRLGIANGDIRRLIVDDLKEDDSPADQMIRSIINSGIDADKLAYLPDDAFFTGVQFGNGIDLQALLDNMAVAEVDLTRGGSSIRLWHLIFGISALPAVESVCFARYWNFQRVYWHPVNRAIASMIIWTIRALVSKGYTVGDYLKDTKDVGESGALEVLSKAYSSKVSKESAPIANLASDRGRIYKRVYEMSFASVNPQLLFALQRGEGGLARRSQLEDDIRAVVATFAKQNGYGAPVLPGDVLLDVPQREMDLGGPIFIRGFDGSTMKGVDASGLLGKLKEDFAVMSMVLRVFVSPDIRKKVDKSRWEDTEFRAKIFAAIEHVVFGGSVKTEIT